MSEAGDDVAGRPEPEHQLSTRCSMDTWLQPSSCLTAQAWFGDTNLPENADCPYPVPSARKHNTGRQQIPNIIYVFVNKAVEQAEKYS